MLSSIIDAFKVPELRKKILFTLGILALYRFGAYVPVPGIPFNEFATRFVEGGGVSMTMLDLFTGGALSNFSVFSLGIMPYITASIIMQLMQGVIPAVGRWAKEGETGRRKITQVTRYLTLGLGLINAIGYLLLFKSPAYGVVFSSAVPGWLTDVVIVFTLVAGTAFIMWMGELITQRGVGNGMSLIIFVSIVSRVPSAIFSSLNLTGSGMGVAVTVLTIVVVLVCIPLIIFVERAQRRIPVVYAKRVQGRKMMGGQTTYIPLKVNAAGVIPIIFASCIIYFPAQLAALFNVDWLTAVADAISTGWINWILTVLLIVFFAYFYTSMVFNPEETSDNLHKQGGSIPGVRPGSATVVYIKNVLRRVTLPGGIFIAAIAVIPSIIFYFTGNTLVQAFGGTSILIMIGVALDTMGKGGKPTEDAQLPGLLQVA